MPSKKKKYNARFPAGRIKKIMQSDEEIGKVAQAVPVIISRTLELFVESLLTKTLKITNSRNAKTLSTSHMKQCIMSEQRFDFLRELVKNIPDISVAEEAANYQEEDGRSSPEPCDSDTPYDLSLPSTSTNATATATSRPITRTTTKNGEGNNKNNGYSGQIQHSGDNDLMATIQRLKQRVGAPYTGNVNSMSTLNTTSYNKKYTEELPTPKLSRSDSMPVHQQRIQLKHKSQSVPSDNADPLLKLKRQENVELPPKQPKTAIPAPPIVSYDFCSKPIVKIDYSNLQLPTTTITSAGVTSPLTAPANFAGNTDATTNSTFNFSTHPVINIDLSNIVPNIENGNVPAVAKISISTGHPTTQQQEQPTIVGNALTVAETETDATLSKATVTSTSTYIPKGTSKATATTTAEASVMIANATNQSKLSKSRKTRKNNSINNHSLVLELDEDYDNI